MDGCHAIHDSHATRFRDAGPLTTQAQMHGVYGAIYLSRPATRRSAWRAGCWDLVRIGVSTARPVEHLVGAECVRGDDGGA
eukprot:scaffold86333_cov40-Phaeocystis_antarctica.AAC.1